MNSSSNEFCRLCLRFDANVSVFAHDSSHFGNLSAKIFECVSVQISIDDCLPLTICNLCEKNVNNWCEFKSVCDRTQRTLFLWLNKLSSGTKEEIQRGLKEQAKKRGFELGYYRNSDHWNSLSSVESKKYSYAPLPRKKREHERHSFRDNHCRPVGTIENLVKRIRIESTHSLVPQPSASKKVSPQKGTPSQTTASPVLPVTNVQQADSTRSAEQVNEVQSSDNTGEEIPRSQGTEVCSRVFPGDAAPSQTELVSRESPVSTADAIQLPATTPFVEPVSSLNLTQPSVPLLDDSQAMVNQTESENSQPTKTDVPDSESLLSSDEPGKDNQPVRSEEPGSESQPSRDGELENLNQRTRSDDPGRESQPTRSDEPASEDQPASDEPDRQTQPSRSVQPGNESLVANDGEPGQESQLTTSDELEGESQPARSDDPGKESQSARSDESGSEGQPARSESQPARNDNQPARSGEREFETQLPRGNLLENESEPAEMRPSQRLLSLLTSGQSSADGNTYREHFTEESAYEDSDAADRAPSPAYSTSSYQTPYTSWSQQIDYESVRVKDEPLSDPEDYLGDPIELPVMIKQEPLDESVTRDETSVSVASTSSSRPPRGGSAQCLTCQQKFKNQDSLRRHFTTEIHKKMTNLISDGQRVSRQTRNYWAKKIRSEAKARAATSFLGNGIRAGSQPPLTPSNESLLAENLPSRSDLLECTVCNVVLRSRSLKIKHDNSLVHKNALAAHNASSEPIHPIVSREADVSFPVTTYACPFASCNLSFFDGGQLIVHMHSHGISLPMAEVDKQVKLGQQMQQHNQIQQQKQQNQFQLQNQQTQELDSNHLDSNPSSNMSEDTDTGFSINTCKCGRSFNSLIGLSNHLRYCKLFSKQVTSKHQETCPVCLGGVKNRRCLVYHIKMYHPGHPVPLPPSKEITASDKSSAPSAGSGSFKCNTCAKTFRSRLFLSLHLTKYHKKARAKRFPCKFCKKVFSSPEVLHSHLKTHSRPRREYPCDKCQLVFPKKSLADQHMSEECSLKIKIFSCNDCGHSYNTQESLDTHKSEFHVELNTTAEPSTGSPNMSQTCDICFKEYSSYANMKRHQKLHFADSVKRTFPCNECNGVFPNIITRSSHKCAGKSNDIKPEAPSNCLSTPDLIEATDSSELVPPKFKTSHFCQYCNSKFLERKYLTNHLRNTCKMVPEMFCENCNTRVLPWHYEKGCKVCGFKPVINSGEKEKVSSSTGTSASSGAAPPSLHRCPLGKRTFLTQKSMLNHATSCSGDCKEQSVNCKFCHKSFSTPKIYLLHKPCPHLTIDGRFPCRFCTGLYKTRSSCASHMRVQHNYYVSKELVESQLEDGASEGQETAPGTPVDSVPKKFPVASAPHEASAGEIKCQHCCIRFENTSKLQHHVKMYHKALDCTFCGNSYLRRDLYEHGYSCIKSQLQNETMLECVNCNNEFLNGDDDDTISLKLQEHLIHCYKLSYNKGDKFSRCKEKILCIKCCILFSSKASLTAHMAKRHGMYTPSKKVKNDSAVEDIHKKVGESIGSSAGIAENETERPAESNDNRNPVATPVHVPQPTFKCPRCSKQFKYYKNMKAHSRTAHSFNARKKKKVPIKPNVTLQCKFCLRQFLSESKLLNHEKVHGIVQQTVMKEAMDNSANAEHLTAEEAPTVPNDNPAVDLNLTMEETV